MTMNCHNPNLHDLLPELALGRLDPARLAECRAHVDACDECREELALISSMQAAARRAKPLDIAAIVRALPAAAAAPVAPPASDVVDIASRRRTRSVGVQWRAAAAAMIVALGTAGVVVARRTDQPAATTVASTAAVSPTVGAALPPSATVSAVTSPTVATTAAPSQVASAAPVAESPTLLVSGAAHDLSTAAQAKLLRELEALDPQLDEAPEQADFDFEGAGL